jgi:putative N6-adenine-specific DNA methylase
MRFLVTAAKGLEKTVADELRGLGLTVLDVSPGIVAFKGRREEAWRANLWLRAGRRVLLPIGSFQAGNAESLYEGARALPWTDVLSVDRTFAVEATAKNSPFNHSGFVALKVKDAVADAFRKRFNKRPDVDRRDPDVGIVVHVAGRTCTVSLDVSGGPLHKRGYRVKSVSAPLNETLAAGMLLMAGYDGRRPFADPFCGSGTILIEAALIASSKAPGLLRPVPFGFQRWPDFDERAWNKIRSEAERGVRRPRFPVFGTDRSKGAVVAATANAAAAGVDRWARVERHDVADFEPEGHEGLIVTNPPYGDHAGTDEDLASLYGSLGDVLKQRCRGWTACVLTGNPALGKCVGLHAKRKVRLFNGPMECRMLVYEMYEGSRKPSRRDRAPED